MSDHEWCRDVRRDEAVRAAEDAAAVPSIQHRDLPEVVALLSASVGDLIGRVVRLEGEMDAGQDEEAAPAVCDSASPAEGMRTERVTLEVTHRANRDACRWPWHRVCNLQPSESVRVVDTHAEAVAESVAWEGARDAYRGCIARMAAERDSARAECERLRACADPFGEEMAVIAAWERCAITANWPADEPETAVRCAASMEREIVRLRARVAELEAAPAGNAGGESNNPQQPESLPEQVAFMMSGPFEKRVFLSREEVYAYRRKLSPIEAASVIFVPLYAAPPPRGWLTAEEREEVQGCLRLVRQETSLLEQYQPDHPWMDHWLRTDAALSGLLARETPPRVRRPNPHVVITTVDARERIDRQWIASIRAAGGEVEG